MALATFGSDGVLDTLDEGASELGVRLHLQEQHHTFVCVLGSPVKWCDLSVYIHAVSLL